jgi:hypothetical protein
MTSYCTGHCRSVGTSSQPPERKSKEQEILRHFVIVNTGPSGTSNEASYLDRTLPTIVNLRWGFLFETRRKGEYLSWPFFWRGGLWTRGGFLAWDGVGWGVLVYPCFCRSMVYWRLKYPNQDTNLIIFFKVEFMNFILVFFLLLSFYNVL